MGNAECIDRQSVCTDGFGIADRTIKDETGDPTLDCMRSINSPISALVVSPPALTTITTPGDAMSIALCSTRCLQGRS